MRKMKKMTERTISFLLSVLMIVAIFPVGALHVLAASDTGLEKIEGENEEDYGFLGWTFNALSEEPMSGSGSLTGTSVFDHTKLEAFVMGDANRGVLSQGSTVEFASSAKEMMQKLGVEVSASAKGKVGISKVKAGFESKFSAEVDYTSKDKVEELFYYYSYRAVCENYRLKTFSSYAECLNTDFINALDMIDPTRPSSMQSFFERYGTHVLIQYDRGAQMTLSASAVSTSTKTELKSSLSFSEITASSMNSAAGEARSSLQQRTPSQRQKGLFLRP